MIIATAMAVRETEPRKTCVVSRDINMRVICDSIGLPSEDYTTERVVHSSDELYSGLSTHLVDDQVIERFYADEDVLSKEITLAYRIGTGKRNYIEKTIYGYEKQALTSQTLSLNVRFRQKWGNISSYLNGTQFFNDGTKKTFSLRSDLDIRVFEGLAVRLSGNVNLIREQYSLAAGNTSVEDLLLQQRQIATDYRTSFSVGLSYTFGSIYNSIINTRL